MLRAFIVSIWLVAVSAFALYLVSGGKTTGFLCPDAAQLTKVLPSVPVKSAGYIEFEEGLAADVSRGIHVYQVVITAPAAAYATDDAANQFSDAVMRAVVSAFTRLGIDPGSCKIRLIFNAPDDLLLTDDIPSIRRFERLFADVTAEVRLTALIDQPVWLLSSLDVYPVKLSIPGISLRETTALLGKAAGDPVWGAGELDVNGVVIKRLSARLLFVLKAARMDINAVDVGVFPAETARLPVAGGDIVMVGPLPLALPQSLPASPSLKDTVPLDETRFRVAIDSAYEAELGHLPAGVLLVSKTGMTYEDSATTKERIREADSILAWGEHRFPTSAALYTDWRYIIVHHTATETGSLASIDRFHRDKGMENGAAYHFIIGNGDGMKDGEIVASHRWDQQLNGGHVGDDAWNRMSIGIVLVGNFEDTQPSKAQMDSLAKLVRFLMVQNKIPLDHVIPHRLCPISQTLCPGKQFPWNDLVTRLSPSGETNK